jgi:hypothetical protein
MSDAICRFSDGRGDLTRELFTTAETRSVRGGGRLFVLTGVADFVAKPDLNDRSILINKDKLRDEDRQFEETLQNEFDDQHGQYLGALLDIVAHGLERLPNVKLPYIPRRADFARWATACEEGYAESGAFLQAYEANQDRSIEALLEANSVAQAVLTFGLRKWNNKGDVTWTGTATQLLESLTAQVGEQERKGKAWPKRPWQLTRALNVAAPLLKGVYVDTRARTATSRQIMLTWTEAGLQYAEARLNAEAAVEPR